MSTLKGFDKVKELIENNSTCMFVTIDEQNDLRSRPMHTVGVEDSGKIYFFTDRYSGKINELRSDQSVNLGYAYPDSNNYLSITGEARILDNQDLIDKYWSPVQKAWFPDGKDNNPRLKLIEVSPKKAEYWDATSSSIIELINVGVAIAKGEKYASGEHEKMTVQ